jgi:hypothetical protein
MGKFLTLRRANTYFCSPHTVYAGWLWPQLRLFRVLTDISSINDFSTSTLISFPIALSQPDAEPEPFVNVGRLICLSLKAELGIINIETGQAERYGCLI